MSADRAAGNRDNVVMQDRDRGFRLPADVQKTGVCRREGIDLLCR
jgi:hypothetical protein